MLAFAIRGPIFSVILKISSFASQVRAQVRRYHSSFKMLLSLSITSLWRPEP